MIMMHKYERIWSGGGKLYSCPFSETARIQPDLFFPFFITFSLIYLNTIPENLKLIG